MSEGGVTRGRREAPAGESLVVSGPAGAVEFSLMGFDWHHRRPPYEGAAATACYLLGGTCYPEGGSAGKWRGAADEDVLAELDRRYAEMAAGAAEGEPRYCAACRIAGNDDSRLGRDVVHHLEGAPPEGLLADVCEAAGHVFPVGDSEDNEEGN